MLSVKLIDSRSPSKYSHIEQDALSALFRFVALSLSPKCLRARSLSLSVSRSLGTAWTAPCHPNRREKNNNDDIRTIWPEKRETRNQCFCAVISSCMWCSEIVRMCRKGEIAFLWECGMRTTIKHIFFCSSRFSLIEHTRYGFTACMDGIGLCICTWVIACVWDNVLCKHTTVLVIWHDILSPRYGFSLGNGLFWI